MTSKSSISLVLMLLVAGPAAAYKEPLHSAITRRAFARLDAEIGLLKRLGAEGKTYGGLIPARLASDGAFAEDHPLNRTLNHFLDPATGGSPLTVRSPFTFLCTQMGAPADFWVIDSYGLNSWGIRDTKDRLHLALIATDPESREQHEKEFFTSLGHLVHLIQDMAQPEHTRNDQHLIGEFYWNENRGLARTTGSLYEEWSFDNLVKNIAGLPIPELDRFFNGYPTVKLPTYRDYFKGGKGMADFANLNFVTQSTNYDDEERSGRCIYHAEPQLAHAFPRTVIVDESLLDDNGIPYIEHDVIEEVFYRPITDQYTGGPADDANHTFFSSVDLDVRKHFPGHPGVYSLGPSAFQSRAEVLIPRAVGYSTGLMQHLLRGQIDVRWSMSVGGGGWDMMVVNHSDEPIGDAILTGLYRKTPDYFGLTNGDDAVVFINRTLSSLGHPGIPARSSITVRGVRTDFLRPGDTPFQVERRIALYGKLGTEEQVAMGIVQPALDPVRIEYRWSSGTDIRASVYGSGFTAVGGINFSKVTDFSNSGVSVIPATASGGPIIVTVDRAESGSVMSFHAESVPKQCNLQWTVYVRATRGNHVIVDSARPLCGDTDFGAFRIP